MMRPLILLIFFPIILADNANCTLFLHLSHSRFSSPSVTIFSRIILHSRYFCRREAFAQARKERASIPEWIGWKEGRETFDECRPSLFGDDKSLFASSKWFNRRSCVWLALSKYYKWKRDAIAQIAFNQILQASGGSKCTFDRTKVKATFTFILL